MVIIKRIIIIMSAYVIIGYFINAKDLKKLERYDETTYIVKEETVDKNSCSHLPDEAYKNEKPNYCPECGTKIRIIPGEKATYKTSTKFIGYQEGFLAPLIPEKSCGCSYCNFCDCEKCDDCSKCKRCEKCHDYDNYSRNDRNKPCKPIIDLKITDTELYEIDRHNEYCNRGYGDCYCDILKYGKDVRVVGFTLANGHILTYDELEGFFILYKAYDFKYDSDILELNEDYMRFKYENESFLEKFDIEGSFELRIQKKSKY